LQRLAKTPTPAMLERSEGGSQGNHHHEREHRTDNAGPHDVEVALLCVTHFVGSEDFNIAALQCFAFSSCFLL
jgi:hypothetical protein